MLSACTSHTGALLRLCHRHTLIRGSRGAIYGVSPLWLRRTAVTPAHPSEPATASSPRNGTHGIEKMDSKTVSTTTLYLDSIHAALRERTNLLASAVTLNMAEIGGKLNKVTGYEHIEMLKHKVVETEASIAAKRQASRDAKAAYEAAVARRSHSQREVNDLLQRKSSWSDSDVSRFTALVRKDHLYEQEEAQAKAQVAVAEAEVETEFNELMRTILNRYHEEQVWSDKIRSASTYGSLLVLGVNIGVFILAIMVVEPYKRRRLAQTFEKRIEELSLENRELLGKGMGSLAEQFEKQDRVLAELTGTSMRSDPAASGTTIREGGEAADPTPLKERTAKAARDRELLIASALGALGGGVLTFILSYFR